MHTRRDSSFFAVAHFLRRDIFTSCCLKNSVWLSQVNHASQQHITLAEPTKALMKNWAYYSNINICYTIIFSSLKKLSGFLGIKLFKKGEKYHFTLVKWGQIWTNVETQWNVHVCTIFSFFKIHRTFFLFLFFPLFSLSFSLSFSPSLFLSLPLFSLLSFPSPSLRFFLSVANLEKTGKLISYTRIMHVYATILNKIHIKTFVQHYSNKRKRVLFLNIWKECHFGQVHWNKCGCVTLYLFLEQMSH